MYYMYDKAMPHWAKCEDQMDAVLSHVDITDRRATHAGYNYPYDLLDSKEFPPPEGKRACAGMFNVARDLFGETLFPDGYAVDIGSGPGWAAWQLAHHKKTVALDICDHPRYGMGGQERDIGRGVNKVVADVCYMPFRDNSFDIAFGCSAWHHAHDRAKCLDEIHRTLVSGGKCVAIGEVVVKPEHIADASKPEWVRMEGLPNTRESMEALLSGSPFEFIEYLPIIYTPNMQYLGYYSLVREPIVNGIIHGVKA
jgi:SAM-dependent methyltransferase